METSLKSKLEFEIIPNDPDNSSPGTLCFEYEGALLGYREGDEIFVRRVAVEDSEGHVGGDYVVYSVSNFANLTQTGWELSREFLIIPKFE